MADTIPTYEESVEVITCGNSTALHRFIASQEPSGTLDAADFRDGLSDVVRELTATPPADAALADELTEAGNHYNCTERHAGLFLRAAAALRARPQAVAVVFPRQPNGDGGWVVDANYVAAIRKDCFPLEWQPCEEEVEAVLLAVERERAMLAASQSATVGA